MGKGEEKKRGERRRKERGGWIPDQETHQPTAGITQLVGHGPHGWARLCGTRDSLLMTHGLLLKIGLDGRRYDPQPVTCSS